MERGINSFFGPLTFNTRDVSVTCFHVLSVTCAHFLNGAYISGISYLRSVHGSPDRLAL